MWFVLYETPVVALVEAVMTVALLGLLDLLLFCLEGDGVLWICSQVFLGGKPVVVVVAEL